MNIYPHISVFQSLGSQEKAVAHGISLQEGMSY